MRNKYLSGIAPTLLAATVILLAACAKRGATSKDTQTSQPATKSSAPAKVEPAPSPETSSESMTEAAQPAQDGQQQRKLIRVSTLNSSTANEEFQRNVRLVQAQRELAASLSSQIEQTTDTSAKAELQKQLDQVIAKLNENNRKMTQTYGFSLARDYVYVVEKSSIYMNVTPEEAARYQEAIQQKSEQQE